MNLWIDFSYAFEADTEVSNYLMKKRREQLYVSPSVCNLINIAEIAGAFSSSQRACVTRI